MELARQVAHLLRQSGEIDPSPLIGGYVVETRADDRINVYWRVPGRLWLPFLRLHSLRRYERSLAAIGMATALHEDGTEPYLACWLPSEQRSNLRSSDPEWALDGPTMAEPTVAGRHREAVGSR
jgi:hypothetical protein